MNIQDLDIVDNNNQDNWPEGTMKVQDVNDAGRADEGLLARWFADWNGSKITAGTGLAYTLSADTNPTAYYDGFTIVAEIHTENTGAATLNVDSLGAASILKNGTEAIVAGDLPAGYLAVFIYRGTDFNLVATKNLAEADITDTARTYTKAQSLEDNTLTAGANVAWDVDDNQYAKLDLTVSGQLDNPTNPVAASIYMLRVKQTGAFTLSFGTAYRWPDDSPPDFSGLVANQGLVLTFQYDGTYMNGTAVGPYSWS